MMNIMIIELQTISIIAFIPNSKTIELMVIMIIKQTSFDLEIIKQTSFDLEIIKQTSFDLYSEIIKLMVIMIIITKANSLFGFILNSKTIS